MQKDRFGQVEFSSDALFLGLSECGGRRDFDDGQRVTRVPSGGEDVESDKGECRRHG